MLVTSLGNGDDRAYTANVTGPAALLVAKLHKLGERQATPGRLVDKDAHDLYRLSRRALRRRTSSARLRDGGPSGGRHRRTGYRRNIRRRPRHGPPQYHPQPVDINSRSTTRRVSTPRHTAPTYPRWPAPRQHSSRPLNPHDHRRRGAPRGSCVITLDERAATTLFDLLGDGSDERAGRPGAARWSGRCGPVAYGSAARLNTEQLPAAWLHKQDHEIRLP
jgi:hypothetical protein